MSRRLVLFFLSFVLFSQASWGADVVIFTQDNPSALQIAEDLSKQIDSSEIVTSPPDESTYKVVITLGNKSFNELKNTAKPHIASFVSYNSFNTQKNQSEKYAVYSDPDPNELALEIGKKFPNSRIGYIFADTNEPYLARLRATGIKLAEQKLVSDDIFKTFRFIFNTAPLDAFYITENREIFNRKNILYVLESLFRNKVAAISSNPALQTKGAVLTVVASHNSIISKTADITNSLINKDVSAVKKHNFANTETMVNNRLASFMNLEIKNKGGEDDQN